MTSWDPLEFQPIRECVANDVLDASISNEILLVIDFLTHVLRALVSKRKQF